MPSKRISEPAFAGDDGSPDPRLAAAATDYGEDRGRLPEVLSALHSARVLAPVVATPGEVGVDTAGLHVDKTSDIALPLLLDGDGRRAVPIFSGVEAMGRWDPAARPVPVQGPRAAAVALAEGAEALVLDIAGPSTVTLGEPELRALVEGRGTVAAYDDEGLGHELANLLAQEIAVCSGWIAPWAGADARLTVVVAPGQAVEELARRLAERLREPARRAGGGVRGLDLAVRVGGEPEPPGRRLPFRHLS